MRKFLQLLQIPPHFHHDVIQFRLEIILQTVIEQLRESPKHPHRVSAREPDIFEEFDSGYELVFDASGEQRGVLVHLGDADALEEVHGGAEAVLDAAGEQSGASVNDAPEIGAVDAGLPEEEGEDGDDVGDPGGEDFGAHAGDSAELDGGEAEGSHVIDGGFDVGERGGEDRRVVVDEGEEVEAHGVEVEHFLLELGIGLGASWGGDGGDFRGFGGFEWERDGCFEGREGREVGVSWARKCRETMVKFWMEERGGEGGLGGGGGGEEV